MDQGGKSVGIDRVGHIALPDPLSDAIGEVDLGSRAILDHHVTDWHEVGRLVCARQRNHTAAWQVLARELFGGRFQEMGKGLPRRCSVFRQRALDPRLGGTHEVLGRLAVKALLAAERIVKCRRADAHLGDELLEGRALVAILPKELHCLAQHRWAVECGRPTAAAFLCL